MSKSKKICLILGPLFFLLSFIPFAGLEQNVRLSLGTVLWMGIWWVTMPVSPAITAFLPVVVNALFKITDMSSITNSYSAELIFLLAGANIITMAWEVTGVDQRLAATCLSVVGTSVRQQVIIWFLLATVLSAFLPNTVVAAILCSIAMSMLKFVGEGDPKKSRTASLVLLAIVWGANNGGMFTPLGGAMNLITVNYVEQLFEIEFMYTDWVVAIFPFGVMITLITLIFLFFSKTEKTHLDGSKEYFRNLNHSFGKLSGAGKASAIIFAVAVALSFGRQLYQTWFPALKPGYVFVTCSLIIFFLKDEKGQPVITWEHAEKNMMWGLFFLFAGGTALGNLVNGSGAAQVFADMVAGIEMKSSFVLILVIVTLNVVLSDIVNNTACAAITIPIIISIVQGLNQPVIPYLWIATVSYNISYTLPTSIRAIPVGYGLSPGYMAKRGVAISVVIILSVSVLGWLLLQYWPAFSALTM